MDGLCDSDRCKRDGHPRELPIKIARESKQAQLLRVAPVGEWGRQLRVIAEGKSTSLDKNREVASLCWTILCTVRFGVGQSAMSWADEDAKVWQDQGACPAVLKKKLVPEHCRGGVAAGVKANKYPHVILGQQYWVKPSGEKFSRPVSLRLHRFVCWLARGNPTAATNLACHKCGVKQCLKLSCLSWGNHASNRGDADQLVAQMGKLRIKG